MLALKQPSLNEQLDFGVGTRKGVGFLLFLRPKFGYFYQNLPANVFYEVLERKIVENNKTRFSRGKTNFLYFF